MINIYTSQHDYVAGLVGMSGWIKISQKMILLYRRKNYRYNHAQTNSGQGVLRPAFLDLQSISLNVPGIGTIAEYSECHSRWRMRLISGSRQM